MARTLTKEPSLLGRREDDRTEFKRAEILRNPDAVMREVVAMLNGRGGEIWIGVVEENGVATGIEEIPDSEKARASILDRILDTIIPRPNCSVELEIIGEKKLLHIKVPRSSGEPHVHVKGVSFAAYERLADHVRPISYEELKGRILATTITEKESAQRASATLAKLKDHYQTEVDGTPGLWICLVPESADDDFIRLEDQALRDEFINPKNVDLRQDGWTWWSGIASPKTELKPGFLQTGRDDPPYKLLRVYRNGSLTLTESDAPTLQWRNAKWAEAKGVYLLYPYAVVEYPVSLFRLASWLWREKRNTRVLATMAFGPSETTELAPGRPETIEYSIYLDMRSKSKYLPGTSEFFDVSPIQFQLNDIVKTPDQCAFRLLSRFYEAFGHFPDKIPFYDARTNRFAFP